MNRAMLLVPLALALVGASVSGMTSGAPALDDKNVYVVGVSGMT